MTTELEALQRQMSNIRARITEIRAEETKREDARYVGKYFKVSNC